MSSFLYIKTSHNTKCHRLLSHDVRPVDHSGQMSSNQTGWDWRDLAPPIDEVPPTDDGAGGKVSLRDGAVGRGGWKQESREQYMSCVCFGNSILRRRSGGFSSLTRGMRSMRRTRQPFYGLSGMSGPVARSLSLTSTATEPHWCFWDTGDGSGHFLNSK